MPKSTEIPALARALRSRMGWTQAELAGRLLISRNYLSLVEGGHKAASARLAAALRGLAADPLDRPGAGPAPAATGSLRAGGPAARRLPLVAWEVAGRSAVAAPWRDHEAGPDQIITVCADPEAWAVAVAGEAMLPDFKPGDRVVVAPGAEPRPGAPVLAGLKAGGMVLRLFHPLNPRTVRLSSLRPEIYPPLDYPRAALRWVWPVVELSRRV